LDTLNQSLARVQSDKSVTESLLASQVASWKAVQGGGQNPETLDTQLDALQDQLATLQAKYTAEHPDVIKLKNQIEDLKKRITQAAKAPTTTQQTVASTIEPPQIQQLRAKIKQDELSITELTRRQSLLQDQIHVLQGRIQMSPAVEQQYKQLT